MSRDASASQMGSGARIKTLDTAGPDYVGGNVQFTVTVSNGGPATAADVDIINVPGNLTIMDTEVRCHFSREGASPASPSNDKIINISGYR